MRWRLDLHSRRAAVVIWLGLLSAGVLPGSPPLAEPAPYPSLSPQGEPLRAAFNDSVGAIRLLFILDPT